MIANHKCPRYRERLGELRSSLKWVQREKSRARLRSKLDSILGTGDAEGWGNSASIDSYFDALQSRTCHAKTLPCARQAFTRRCVTKSMSESILAEGDWEYSLLYSDEELPRLAVGSFLYEIYRDIQLAADGSAPYKLGVNLGHDTTVAPLLGALGAPAPYWVPYASHVEVELWRHSSNKSASEVHVFFNGVSLHLPQCSGRREGGEKGAEMFFCTLQEFAAVAAPGAQEAFVEACQPKRTKNVHTGPAHGEKVRSVFV